MTPPEIEIVAIPCVSNEIDLLNEIRKISETDPYHINQPVKTEGCLILMNQKFFLRFYF
jgi:hypothetical protein